MNGAFKIIVQKIKKGVFIMPEADKKSNSRLFCCYYARLGDIYESAIRSGFPPETALADGTDIINQGKNQRLINNLMSKSISHKDVVMTGLHRLAFGRANDAALLVFSEETPSQEQINSLDLFNVSEMKKVKGGGVEIKLFDRQKAMERLYEYASEVDSSAVANNLIEALSGMGADDQNEV